MVKRLYVNNFRTLVNFEIEFGPLTLLLGPNGGGKSSVFDTIGLLGEFLRGEKTTTELFPSSSLTRWQRVDVQTLEIAVATPEGEYSYHVEIEHDRERDRSRVRSERLTLNARPLFESSLSASQLTAQLYRDDGSKGPTALTDWSRSTLAGIQPIPENLFLTGFKQRMTRVVVTRLNPAMIGARADEEHDRLRPDASNFVAWFRHVASADLELVGRLKPLLREALDGLESLGLAPDGVGAKVLRAQFLVSESQDRGLSMVLRFDELSDGQRALFVLYTLLAAAPEDSTLCCDEPENFLALREISPWLNHVMDKTLSQSYQAILISHHPELIDALALGGGRWIDRVADGPSRARPISNDGTGLSVSELVSRGWIHAQ